MLGQSLGYGSATTKLLLHLDGNANDSSGNGNNGTATNVTWATGKNGSGSAYSSGTGYIKGTTGASAPSAVSFGGWVRYDARLTNERFCIAFGGDATGETLIDLGMWQSYGYNLVLRACVQNTTNLTIVDTGYNPTLSTWFHVVVTRNGATAKCYVNGKLQSSTSSFTTNALSNGKYSILVDGGYTTNSMQGYVDEAFVESFEMTEQQVKKLFAMNSGRFGII